MNQAATDPSITPEALAPVKEVRVRSHLPKGKLYVPAEESGSPLAITAPNRKHMGIWLLDASVAPPVAAPAAAAPAPNPQTPQTPQRTSRLNLPGRPPTAAERSARKRVWLLYTDKQYGTIQFQTLRTALKRENYTVENTVTIESGMLRALYEDHEESAVESQAKDNELIQYYERMVEQALKDGVSDIHVERRKTRSSIRMRRHGHLNIYAEISSRYASQLCSVIYNVLAENKDINYAEDDYQSAAINSNISNVEVKLRYQSMPVYPGGFDVVMRVLPIGDEDETFTDLEKLGYTATQVRTLQDIANKPVGAMIIAGTTGSGKSTTLKNLLMFINASRSYRCKIFTIEDPPEYRIPKVSQIPVVRRKNEDYSKKSPFADPLVATMRGDPDILMIGEIRDTFTGDGLKKATQSGHQVLTTVHAASALGIIERLQDFGITASVMGSPDFLNGLIYQKLLPRICQECALPFMSTVEASHANAHDIELYERLKRVVDFDRDTIRIVRPQGCPKCKGIGVSGRTVCAEIIAPDFKMLKLFRKQQSIEAYEYWRDLSDNNPHSDNMNGKTVLEHALQKMRAGLVSPHDVEEVLGPVDSAHRMLEQLRADRQAELEAAKKRNEDD